MKLVIVRGLPGSGKTTYAQTRGYLVVEGDQFRYDDEGIYRYSKETDASVFKMCRELVAWTLMRGYSVISTNTYLTNVSMEYIIKVAEAHGATVEIKEMNGGYDNVHGVSRDIIGSMADKWEALKPEWEKYKI